MPLNSKIKRHRVLFPLPFILISILMACSCAFSAVKEPNQPIRVRIFNMRNITGQQAKDYLTAAKINSTAVIIPGTNAISVTAAPEELVYASNLLKVVDSNEPYEIKFIDLNEKMPDNLAIENKLGPNFSVGTLLEGTGTTSNVKAIVDSTNGALLIAAPKVEMDNIVNAVKETSVEEMAKAEREKAAEANLAEAEGIKPKAKEPNEPNKSAQVKKSKTEPEDLGEFMNELAQAEQADKEAKQSKKAQEITGADSNYIQHVETAKSESNTNPQKGLTEKVVLTPPESNESVDKIIEESKPAIKKAEIPNADEVLELNLPEELDVVTLIDLVGKYLNLNYLYDKTKVTGTVNLKVQGKIRVGELYSLLENVLKFKGFVMSRKGSFVTIVPEADALSQDPILVDGTVKPGDVAVTKVFRLKYINTASAKKLLTEMKLGSNITEIPEIGTLVITEYAFRMQRIEDLLNLVDVPGPPKDFELRVLKYTLADSLVTKIKALAEQLGTVEITIGTSSAETGGPGRPTRIIRPMPQPGVPGQPGGTSTTGENTNKGVFIDSDKRTNRILMIGQPADLKAVNKIIDSLDVPQQDLRTIREYEIQHVDVTKVIEALQELNIIEGTVGGTSTQKGPNRRPTVNRPGGPGETVQQPNINQQASALGSESGTSSIDQPQVVSLESTNSLLVNATPEQQVQIQQIISYVDREAIEAAIPYRIYRLENQDPKDLAETLNGLIGKTEKDAQGKIQETVKYTEDTIVIVPDKGTFSLIVYASKKNQEWIGNLIDTLDRRRPQVLIDVSLVEITRVDKFNYDLDIVANATGAVSNTVFVSPLQATGKPVPTGTNLEGSVLSGDLTAFYSSSAIQALLKLVDHKGYGRVLARPKVLVNDNEKGTISTEDTRYVTKIQTTALAGQTQTSSVQSSVSFDPYTAKIQLEITPQISEGKLLRLEVKMERNDFVGDGTTITLADGTTTTSPPNEKKSSVNTIVTVPDGSTIILGGLTKLAQNKNTNKVPLLGDVPIAGTIFRNAEKLRDDSKLYIFVKANILRPELSESLKQLRDISQKNRAEFERDEAKFQQHELFPGIPEKPMDPNKVLEQ